jgi:hypothetical protein
MNGEDLEPVMALVAGLWPTPEVTYEEALAWSAELTGRQKITRAEAMGVLQDFAESGTQECRFRPRAGQIISMVQAHRRKRATERPIPELPGPQDFSSDIVTTTLASCREAINRNKENLARRAEERRKALSTTTASERNQ